MDGYMQVLNKHFEFLKSLLLLLGEMYLGNQKTLFSRLRHLSSSAFLPTLLAHSNFSPFLVIIGSEQPNQPESSFPHSHRGVGPVEQRGSRESLAFEEPSECSETTRC